VAKPALVEVDRAAVVGATMCDPLQHPFKSL
jgi:hypothetical protein